MDSTKEVKITERTRDWITNYINWIIVRLHKTHSINSNYSTCDYDSCKSARVYWQGIRDSMDCANINEFKVKLL